MLEKNDYAKVADELRSKLGMRQFLTLTRREVTDILREVSGQPATRVKVLVAQAITEAVENRGLTFYPSLNDVNGKDSVRLVRVESMLPELIDILNNPSEANDAKLRAALRQVSRVAVAA